MRSLLFSLGLGLAVVRGIVGFAADLPEVGLHGLLTSRLILLREEVSLVGSHLHEVDCACFDIACYSCEACASLRLISSNRRGAVVLANHVDAGAIRVGGRRYAVRSQEGVGVVAVRLTCFGSLAQKAGHIVDTFCPFNFCHNVLGLRLRTTA